MKKKIRLTSFKDVTVFQRHENVLARKNSDGTIRLLKMDNDEHFFTIYGFAASAWTLIDGKKSLNEIMDKLKKSHPKKKHVQKENLNVFIKDLLKEGLIQTV